ncbi:MAG: peptidylprolyl isomerase [Rickettsiales bacterium]|nr:peptidylprolyl isomerase [Rickettsiales bacterium]
MKRGYRVLLVGVVAVAIGGVTGAVVIKHRRNKYFLRDDEVFATSTKGDVYVKDVKEYLDGLERVFNQKLDINALKKEEKELVASEIVNNRIILEKAREKGIVKTDEYRNRIKKFEELTLKEIFLQDLVDGNITDEAVKAKYEEIVTTLEGKKEFRVKHIVVKTRVDIESVMEELKTKTFEEVAEKYSIDNSKNSGGDLGYVVEGQTVKEFEDVLKSQPLNKLSRPFETQFGWHVLLKEEERKAIIPAFSKIKDSIRNSLTRDFVKSYSLKNIEGTNIRVLK